MSLTLMKMEEEEFMWVLKGGYWEEIELNEESRWVDEELERMYKESNERLLDEMWVSLVAENREKVLEQIKKMGAFILNNDE